MVVNQATCEFKGKLDDPKPQCDTQPFNGLVFETIAIYVGIII